MKIISSIKEFRTWRKGMIGSVGVVPTMGALHEGHLSLVEQSNKICQNTVVSIYLNPTQFAPDEDLDTYPKTVDSDTKQLSNYNTSCIFLPKDSEMYPKGFSTEVQVTGLSRVLEGKSRPNFFGGVTAIVSKLFNIVEPTHAFFGEKDAQQVRIIQQMVLDLNYPIKIISCPIIREKSGLAMSSPNQHLTADAHKTASVIFQALQSGKNLIFSGEKKRRCGNARNNIGIFSGKKRSLRERPGLEQGSYIIIVLYYYYYIITTIYYCIISQY